MQQQVTKTYYRQNRNRHLYDPDRKSYVSLMEVITDMKAGLSVRVLKQSAGKPQQDVTSAILRNLLFHHLEKFSQEDLVELFIKTNFAEPKAPTDANGGTLCTSPEGSAVSNG